MLLLRNSSFSPWSLTSTQALSQIFGFSFGPVLTGATASQSWLDGAAASLTLASNTFTDSFGLRMRYSATLASGAALPSWLHFNASTLTFSGTPTTAANYTIRVTAVDQLGFSNAEVFSLTTLAAAPSLVAATANAPPKITAQTANQVWIAGSAVTLALPTNTFTDPQASALTYKATLSTGAALPTWLTFNPATETFTGTAPATSSKFTIKLTATDALGLSTSESFTVQVAAAPKLVLQTAGQYAGAGHAVSFTLSSSTFSDPQGSALSYTATLSSGAALPSWLKFTGSSETFSGTTPTTGLPLSIKVTATDTYGLSTSETFTLSYASAPTLVTQTAAQTWTQGKAFSLTLPASTFSDPQGSRLSYTATLSNGNALPSWLKFNATTDSFSGTVPTGTSAFSLKVTATDTYGLSTSETFAVATPAAPAPAVTPPPASGFVINVTYDASVASAPASFKTAVAAAVSYFESEFTNNVTMNINVGWGEVGGTIPLASGALGESLSNYTRQSYATVTSALTTHATSPDDVVSVGTLAGTVGLAGMNFMVTDAEAKALGIGSIPSSNVDGSIGISSAYAMSFDPANRAVSGLYDGIGVIEHEITELMGRTELLNSGSQGYTPFDLFRYTSAGVHDLTPGPGSFSVDGVTMLQTFNNPLNGGDAADWTPSVQGDSFGSGYQGVAGLVTAVDLRVMDVLGWTRASLTS